MVCGKARTLVSLEHAIGKRILLGQLKIGLNIGRINVGELWIRRRAVGNIGVALHGNEISAVHGAFTSRPAIAHLHKRAVGMNWIVLVGIGSNISQVKRLERDPLALRIDPAAGNVGSRRDQHRVVKQVVGCAVLLEDDHHMLDGRVRRATTSVLEEKGPNTKQQRKAGEQYWTIQTACCLSTPASQLPIFEELHPRRVRESPFPNDWSRLAMIGVAGTARSAPLYSERKQTLKARR